MCPFQWIYTNFVLILNLVHLIILKAGLVPLKLYLLVALYSGAHFLVGGSIA